MSEPVVWVHRGALDVVAATGEVLAPLFRSPEGLDYERDMVPLLAFAPTAEHMEGSVVMHDLEDCMFYFYTIPTDGWGGMRRATIILHPEERPHE